MTTDLTTTSTGPTGPDAPAGPPASRPTLSVARLNVMRAGYLFMAAGLTVVKWPQVLRAADRPLYESVTLAMLGALSVLAWLGLRHPAKLLPVLLFESLWKLLWLALVAVPTAVTGDLDAATTEILVSCSLVVVVLAVIPWRHVWQGYVRGPGDPWR